MCKIKIIITNSIINPRVLASKVSSTLLDVLCVFSKKIIIITIMEDSFMCEFPPTSFSCHKKPITIINVPLLHIVGPPNTSLASPVSENVITKI